MSAEQSRETRNPNPYPDPSRKEHRCSCDSPEKHVKNLLSARFRERVRNALRGAIQKYGPEFAKQRLWNREFSAGRWACLETTGDDPVHVHIER
jgi:hypothetical protein